MFMLTVCSAEPFGNWAMMLCPLMYYNSYCFVLRPGGGSLADQVYPPGPGAIKPVSP